MSQRTGHLADWRANFQIVFGSLCGAASEAPLGFPIERHHLLAEC